MISIPNAITLARLCAVPLAVWLILKHEMVLAFWLFVAAGVSDAVDGYIAKRFNAQTAVGAVLDPVADKALLVSVYVTLGLTAKLADWLVILVVFRDIFIVGGILVLYVLGSPPEIAPLPVSKVNTALQIALAAIVLLHEAYAVPGPAVIDALVWGVAASTLASGIGYALRWVRGGGAAG
ncbi:CDP-alcohol phosphatidyltransferase family protein [Elioraea rosea]|uniref:CDP-alcohol phosphatidyltransferase family protein n=1 Tax=Elioraea rosea TaxID=2492390 RepID=UPI001182168E|nr:CDP-alcohol phosphatidyltransferase family protein [Elioraea rosea]